MRNNNNERERGKEIITSMLKEKIPDVEVQWRGSDISGGPKISRVDFTFAFEVFVSGKELWEGKAEFQDLEIIGARAEGSDDILQKIILPIIEHFLDPPKGKIGFIK